MLIAIEGINGCGKSTIISNLKYLYGDKLVVYKFPNRTTPSGKILDKFLKNQIIIDSIYEIVDLFSKNRYEQIDNIINDLKNNKIVICDRYFYSGIAYQIPLHVNKNYILKSYIDILGNFDNDLIQPNITILIHGNFIKKRNDFIEEKYHSRDADFMYNRLKLVIENYTTPIIIENKENKLNDSVKSVFDIIEKYKN